MLDRRQNKSLGLGWPRVRGEEIWEAGIEEDSQEIREFS